MAGLAAEHTEFIIESALVLFLSEFAIHAEFRGEVGGGVGLALGLMVVLQGPVVRSWIGRVGLRGVVFWEGLRRVGVRG